MSPKRFFSGVTARTDDDKLFETVRAVPLPMSKVIHCIRHGQGYHNVAGESNYALYKSFDYEDAHLTPIGWKQTAALNLHIRSTDELRCDLVVVSPMARALETAVGVFGRHTPDGRDVVEVQQDGYSKMVVDGLDSGVVAQNGNGSVGYLMAPLAANPKTCRETPGHPGVTLAGVPPMIAREEAREHYGMHPCDKRRPISEHSANFPGVDFSGVVNNEDVLWTPEAREPEASMQQRARALIVWILRRPERHVAIVAHAGFLRVLTKQLQGDSMRLNHGAAVDCFQLTLENCGLRSFVLSNFATGPIACGTDGLSFQGGIKAAKSV